MQISTATPIVVTGGASRSRRGRCPRFRRRRHAVGIFDMNAERGEAGGGRGSGTAPSRSSTSRIEACAPVSPRCGPRMAGQDPDELRRHRPAAKTVSKGAAHDPGLFMKALAVNLGGSFNCASQAAEGMVAAAPVTEDGERGVIINTASVARPVTARSGRWLSASKGGIVGMTLPMARDLSRDGVRVQHHRPRHLPDPAAPPGTPQEVRDSLGQQVPFPSRLGKPGAASLALEIAAMR
ncbi:MAG: SDR family NAD(P)-dependent oxidoreductase [Paracoccaceae bacterium]